MIRVTDGDTIEVRLSSGPINVRFDATDAPERKQPWGSEATQALARLVADREVEFEVVSQDRYGRLVARVYVAGANVGEQMIRSGHAWAARAYLKRATGTQYCAWEAAARAAKRGLWGLPQDDWIYPPDWRRIERGTTDYYDDYADETVARCVAAIGRR